MFGFGPLNRNAATTRPAAKADNYGVQTWFKDASAAGATDGTVVDASWYNSIVGAFAYICHQANIAFTNDQSEAGDAQLYTAIMRLIGANTNPDAISIVSISPELQGNGTPSAPLDLKPTGVRPGTYTIGGVNIGVDQFGRIVSIG